MPSSRALSLSLTLLGVSVARPSRAAESAAPSSAETTSRVSVDDGSIADGVYGRFDGDLDLGVAAGAEIADSQVSGTVALSAHYFSSVGVRVGYTDAFSDTTPYARALSVDLEIRPLFLPRWSYGMESGPGFLDLLLDSTSIGIGGFWDEPSATPFGDRHGLVAFVGLGIPLFARAEGLWLDVRALRRFTDGSAPGAYNALVFSLSWHFLVETGLARRR
jgi:hypothetical protein